MQNSSFSCILYKQHYDGPLAQLVEHLTLNQGVVGSRPTWVTKIGRLVKRLRHRPFTAVSGVRFPHRSPFGRLAQLGERLPYKQNVGGSIPSAPTIFYFGRSLCSPTNGPVVQLVRMPPCHGGGRGFESHPGRHFASVAQLVEQRTENPCVHSSILC